MNLILPLIHTYLLNKTERAFVVGLKEGFLYKYFFLFRRQNEIKFFIAITYQYCSIAKLAFYLEIVDKHELN